MPSHREVLVGDVGLEMQHDEVGAVALRDGEHVGTGPVDRHPDRHGDGGQEGDRRHRRIEDDGVTGSGGREHVAERAAARVGRRRHRQVAADAGAAATTTPRAAASMAMIVITERRRAD
jgi:hypothetical protein